jgi:PAS domain S-box-containing protein
MKSQAVLGEIKVRRLVDANIIGIIIRELDGRILEANDAFLRIVGYDREDLAAGRLRWTELTPPEWRDASARALDELNMTGAVQPIEKEYLRKDGSRVPVLVGSANFDEGGSQGVAFVLDLTESKRAEAHARESERRHAEVQTKLAHANRVATMDHLIASIAHEVNQPIAATIANAEAALNLLSRQPPDIGEVRQALDSIIKDGIRAADVIDRIRTLIKKKAPAEESAVLINEAILEVVALTRREAAKNGVAVQTQLADGLPLIHGDRVQLQQVLLNLVINAIEALGLTEGVRELQISTTKDELGGVLVAVRDTGPGLAPGMIEAVFEAFYTTKLSGLGLALSICRSIIEAHGGQLWASANAPRGCTFQFTVPAYPQTASDPTKVG